MQHGPGAENAFGGVAQAFSESVPILVVPGRLPAAPGQLLPELQLDPEHAARHQVGRAAHHRAGPSRTCCAAPSSSCATAGPARCCIEVPVDVWNEEMPDDWVHTPSFTARSGARPGRRRRGGRRCWRSAERPVIYAGQGVHYAQAWDELRTLAETLEHPGHHLHRGQERLPREPSAVARQRRPGQSAAGQALPRRRRRDPRRRLQLRADRLRRRHAAGQDDHPRHPRSDGPQQGRGRRSTA